MPNPIAQSLEPPRTPITDARTGAVAREWRMFFLSLHLLTDDEGQNSFIPFFNDTGATISRGATVGFSGVHNGIVNGALYTANSSANPLYFMGLANDDVPDQGVGYARTLGPLTGLDTSAWSAGTILYASATTAGGLTSTRPTAPNAVIVVAAVEQSDAATGTILVRLTVPQGLDYGSFSDTTVQTIAAINTAYPIKHNTTDIAHGISVVNDGSGNPTKITVSQAGLYKISVSNQYTSTNSSAQDIQTWLRQNGTDIANSNSYTTITSNGATQIFSTTYLVSMQANDYIQIMWASNSTNVSINNIAATAYSPAAPSVITTIEQTQL